eukprot:gene13013-13115_t
MIIVLFTIPLAVLVYLFIVQSEGDISFARKEVAGTVYLDKIWPSFMASSFVSGAGSGPFTADPESDRLFSTADASKDFIAAANSAAKLEAGKTLIGLVADGSNLTLDPDLDSFYAMDAATVRMPGIVTAVANFAAAAAEPAGKPERLQDLAVAIDRLQSNAQAADASLTAAIKSNASGLTATALTAATDGLRQKVKALADAGQAVLAGQPVGDLAALRVSLLRQVNETWLSTNRELARLLDVRIAGFSRNMVNNLIFAGIFVALAAILALYIASGLTRRLSVLLAAMDRLMARDAEVEIQFLNDRNETGKIAHSLEAFRQSIVEGTLLNGQKRLAEDSAAFQRKRDDERQALIARDQAQVVSALAGVLKRLAAGDLTVKIDTAFPSDFEDIRLNFNESIDNVRAAFLEIVGSTSTIRNGTEEISVASNDLANRTERQAADLEGAATTLRNMASGVSASALKTHDVLGVVKKADQSAKDSGAIIEQTVAAIDAIAETVRLYELVGQFQVEVRPSEARAFAIWIVRRAGSPALRAKNAQGNNTETEWWARQGSNL